MLALILVAHPDDETLGAGGTILKLIEKHPAIIYLGSGLMGWIGMDMVQSDIFLAKTFSMLSINEYLLPSIGGILVIIFAKFIPAKK